MSNIMVDIETMGQGSNAAIVAIGAVAFDECGIGDDLYLRISLEDAAKHGDIDASTVLWWMRQEDAAREEITKDDAMSVSDALHFFTHFVNGNKDDKGDVSIWGNGSDFDNVILVNMYKKTGKRVPWNFWNNRCFRTMKNIYRDVRPNREGVHHKAIDDARYQAMHLIEIAKKHNISF